MSDSDRTDPTTDLYALYLSTYLSTLTANGQIVSASTTREMQAIALGIEDAMAYRACCEGHSEGAPGRGCDDGRDDVGRRARWNLLEAIEDGEVNKRPADE